MELPVNLKELLDEVTNIKAARETDLSVSVYVDETASAELAAHVRSAFASTSPKVRMTLSYLDANFIPRPTDDVAVVVAGSSAKVGAATAALRAVGVPTMVVALDFGAVEALARENNNAIPQGDLVTPQKEGEEAAMPVQLDDEAAAHLDERMGRWIVSACHDKRLAFANAFPFVRRPLAHDAVQSTSLQNAGIGLVPLLPGADLPIMTMNQAKMVLQIAAAYGREMDKDRLKELAAVVGGAYACRTLARELVEFVPVLGFLVRTGVAYGGTAALGNAVIEYFEGGENVSGVTNVAARAAAAGAKLVGKVRETASDPSPAKLAERARRGAASVNAKVAECVSTARDAASEYLPKIVEMAADAASKATKK